MGWIRIKNDCRGLYIRSDNLGPGAMRKGRRVHCVAGVPMRKVYDASKNKKFHPIYMDEYVCLTELAIRLYNIKENTQFSLVKLLKIVTSQGGYWVNYITFEALSPLGDATVFKTTITQFFGKYEKIEIKPVKLKCSPSGHNGEKSKQDPPLDIAQQPVKPVKLKRSRSNHDGENSKQDSPLDIAQQPVKPVKLKRSRSDHNGENSKQDSPLDIAQQPVIKTFPANTLEDMAPFLSQYALVIYDIQESLTRTGNIKREAFHSISSLKVVKVIKLDAEEGTSYLVTFTASLRDESKNVETFETHICVPTLFPTMIFEVRDIKMIKRD